MRLVRLVCSLVLLHGCDNADEVACSRADCADAHIVELANALPGRYDVRRGLASGTEACAFTLPAPLAVGPLDAEGACASVVVGEGTEAAPVVRITFPAVDEAGARVTVVRDGAVVADARVPLDYRPVYAIGPECGVTCRIATTHPFASP